MIRSNSIIIIILLENGLQFPVQLVDLLVYVLNIFAVSFILSVFILLFIGFFVLWAELVVDLWLFFALLLIQHFFYTGNQTRHRVFVCENVYELAITILLLNISCGFDLGISLNFILWNFFEFVTKIFNLILNFLEVADLLTFLILLLFW